MGLPVIRRMAHTAQELPSMWGVPSMHHFLARQYVGAYEIQKEIKVHSC